MHPRRGTTDWGTMASVVFVMMILSGVVLALSVVTLVPGSGMSIGERPNDTFCVTAGPAEMSADPLTPGPPAADGSTSAESGRVYCTPLRDLSVSEYVRVVYVELAPSAILLGSMVVASRMMKRHADPFTPETAAAAKALAVPAGIVVYLALSARSWIALSLLNEWSRGEGVPSGYSSLLIALAAGIGLRVLASLLERAAGARAAAASTLNADLPARGAPQS